MNKTLTTLFLILALMLALPQAGHAQTATTQTILSAAVTSLSARCVIVASTTGFSASTQTQMYAAWYDGELMRVDSVNTTTGEICGQRGWQNTRATAHPTAAVVWFGAFGGSTNGIGVPFTSSPPVPGASCTSTQYAYLPILDYRTGDLYNCLANNGNSTVGTVGTNAYGRWITYNYRQWTYGHPTVNVVDAAYTATLADEFIIMTRMTAARTITLPAITGIQGKVIVVKNNTENNGIITVAASANQGVGTAGSNTLTLSPSLNNNVLRLVSVATSAGGWSWASW